MPIIRHIICNSLLIEINIPQYITENPRGIIFGKNMIIIIMNIAG